jgi:hypothetical protein
MPPTINARAPKIAVACLMRLAFAIARTMPDRLKAASR